MTFGELQRGVFDDLQYQAQPKPGVQDRIRRYLNEGLERVLRRPRLKSLRVGILAFNTEAGIGFYGAPMAFDRIDYLIDLTNHRRLTFRTRDWYRGIDPGAVMAHGTPTYWIPEGISPVWRQPQVTGGVGGGIDNSLYIESNDARDTTQGFEIHALRPWDGDNRPTSAMLNGLTKVPAYAYGDQLIQVTHFTLSSTAFGTVTLTDNGGRHLAHITTPNLSSRYVSFRLFPTPSAVMKFEIEGQYAIPKMIHPEDEPPFPDNYHEMLQCYARARFYRKDGRVAQSQAEMAEFERYAVDLTAHIEYPPNYRPVASKFSAYGSRWSDLGSNYPADRVGLVGD